MLPALVLAAGFSRRMGQDKLLLPVQGESMLGRVVRTAFAGGLFPVYVVIRPDSSPGVRHVLAELGAMFAKTGSATAGTDLFPQPLVVVDCPEARSGQSASLRAGLRRVMRDVRQAEAGCSGGVWGGCLGVAVFLGDQPFIAPELVQQMVTDFREHAEAPLAPVCRTSAGLQRGHPVFLPARAFAAVLELKGDMGARDILGTFGLRLFPANDTSALVDIDTWEAYTRLCGAFPLNERIPGGICS